MDDLGNVISRAIELEKDQAAAASFEPVDESKSKRTETVKSGGGDSAAEFAESLLVMGTSVAQAFVDSRLCVDDQEIALCRSELAPALDKYSLARGDGKIPYREEWRAGFYLGGLGRRFKRALAQLRAQDKAKMEAKRRAENGGQRKHETQESAYPVPSKERVREKSNVDKEGWNSESWGEGVPMGQQQGPSGSQI